MQHVVARAAVEQVVAVVAVEPVAAAQPEDAVVAVGPVQPVVPLGARDRIRLAHADGHRGPVARPLAVGEAVGEAVGAREAGIRRIGEGAVRVDQNGAVAGVPEQRGVERIAVGVAVVGQHVEGGRAALAGGVHVGDRRDGVIDRVRGVVDRGHRDADRRGGATPLAVGEAVGEAVGAVEVGVRRIGEGAVGIGDNGAIGGPGRDRGAEGIAVGVLVVGQHVDGNRRILVGGRRIVPGDGRRIRRLHRDADRGGSAPPLAVRDAVGEAVGARKTGIGRVGEGAAGIECDAAVGRPGDQRWAERVAVDIAVVGQHDDGDRRALRGRHRVVGRRGGVVDRGHRDAHRRGVGAAVPVRDAVGEAVGAVEVGVRRIGEGAVGIGDNHAIGRPGLDRGAEGVAVDIAVVGQHVDSNRRVLGHRHGVVIGLGRGVRIEPQEVGDIVDNAVEAQRLEVEQEIGALVDHPLGDTQKVDDDAAASALEDRVVLEGAEIERGIEAGPAIERVVAAAAEDEIVGVIAVD